MYLTGWRTQVKGKTFVQPDAPLQPTSQPQPLGALVDKDATSHATSESFLRAMQQQLRLPAVHCRSHSCTEGHK